MTGFALGVGDTLADNDGATFTNDLNGVLDRSNCPDNQITTQIPQLTISASKC